MKNGELHFPTVQSALLIIVATLLLVTIIGVMLEDLETKWTMLLLESFIVLPVLLYVFIQRFSFPEIFKWKKVNIKLFLVSGLIGFGFIPVSDELDHLIQMFIPMPNEITQALETFLVIHSKEEGVLLFFAGVFVATISEELLFRGFLLSTLERTTQITKAIFISAVIFAAVHFNPWWFLTIWIIGILLSLLAWRSGSVFPGMIVHGINNGVAILFANMKSEYLNGYYMKEHVSPIWIVLGLGCIIWGMHLFFRFTEEKHNTTNQIH